MFISMIWSLVKLSYSLADTMNPWMFVIVTLNFPEPSSPSFR
jgi:hypothetical protein